MNLTIRILIGMGAGLLLGLLMQWLDVAEDHFLRVYVVDGLFDAGDINESGRHLLEVISDILDISKIEANRVDLVEEEIVPDRLAEKAIRLIRDRAEQAEIALRLSAP